MELSMEELLSRKETLKQFENYINDTKNTLKCFVENIGWTLDKTPIKNNFVKCPLNSEHRMSPSKLEVHCQKCILKKNGYDSSHSFYPSYNLSTPPAQTVTIDKITQMHILKTAYDESNSTLNINLEPREVSQSIERYVCDFTPDERRVLYDSAVNVTRLSNYKDIKNDIDLDIFNKTGDKPKTELELLQEQRDLKRRRVAYRGKRVHVDRKSYKEVLREVIEGLTNNLSHSEDKLTSVPTSNTITETAKNARIMYKYEGNRKYNGNPYTRWLNIKTEESKLLKYYEKKRKSSYQEVSTSKIHYKDKTGFKRSRKDRSISRERKTSTGQLKLKRSWRSRSRSLCKETNSKRPKIRSKSKERDYVESKHKTSKKHKIRSKESKSRRHRSRSISIENTHKRSKKHKKRSKSKELEKVKCSRSFTDYNKLVNEKDSSIQLKSSNTYKKKKKHKSKKSRSKSPRRSHKNKKNVEVCKNIK
ncbi:U11/U12 small nuclear ribonucleoprotein 48 kDa protein-like [Melanaphis sacchari]|uniref:U11/U12 small nuclear ribonucleoprotein 48 kDa protein-like n=1 Tax=Melanaphis sacchari TaxID=742174 RepID=UPI000DC14462|nr:U11/U12 small nuclear ribonucleoprotein 48 kDa protein-like [Melanaphis sacchari]XP_025208769.1 U11/U12 small nuclear ribonucleoprotein 48 kDa protein-like [Melanaphis sacchari]XP_025208770.1 U11/U12 small nuclear ribonucleoprotein 48 kDa protein-like [Melanaphis sacchari]XP_025208772.1 U11/U12 small nuclear ribonucleoprotein 48 kDa protein-like [Melanaphis sacchari]XP_025208773.1 U11/U12 small nuclear ribonucleoprotein 48 kDa protein-like [Melanaphis sacchari]